MTHPFPLNQYLGTLADGLGCFPFDNETYLPLSDCPVKMDGIRSLIWFGKLDAPYPIQCSTSVIHHRTLALKLFRGEQTRFRFGSAPEVLNLATYRNSLARSTKSTLSLALQLLVSTGFQFLFHSPPGVLFTFPSRYFPLSVTG